MPWSRQIWSIPFCFKDQAPLFFALNKKWESDFPLKVNELPNKNQCITRSSFHAIAKNSSDFQVTEMFRNYQRMNLLSLLFHLFSIAR
jgi:hypothetical protein